jgi:hypothetical protein
MKIWNGQIYEAPRPLCHRVIVQYLGKPDIDTWVLLSTPYETADHNGTAMMLCCYAREDGSFNPWYTQEELVKKLQDWSLCKGSYVKENRLH